MLKELIKFAEEEVTITLAFTKISCYSTVTKETGMESKGSRKNSCSKSSLFKLLKVMGLQDILSFPFAMHLKFLMPKVELIASVFAWLSIFYLQEGFLMEML